MAEYIPREVVLKCIENDGYEEEYDLGYYAHNREFQELIEEIPAADVKPVVLGWWIAYPECLVYNEAYSDDQIICSQCKKAFSILDNCIEEWNFCPNCGADMREVEK